MKVLRKGFLLAVSAFLLVSCGNQSTDKASLFSSLQSWKSGVGIDEALNLVTEKSLKDTLYFISSDDFEGRESGYPANDRAAQYIADKFKSYGALPPKANDYFQPFSVGSGNGKTNNVIGYFPGTDAALKDQIVIIGAHFDHVGRSDRPDDPVEPDDPQDPDDDKALEDTIYNGADDNGSGTVVVLEAVKALSLIKDQLKRTVVLIGFSGEEKGLIGSSFYVKYPTFDLKKTVYMINLDMVGYLRSGNLSFLGGQSSSAAATKMREICKKYPSIKPNITSSAGGGSDHVPFVRNSVPAVFLHTGGHENYHEVTDEAPLVNYAGLTDIAKIATELAYRIAQDTARPDESYQPIEISERDTAYDHDGAPFPTRFEY